jgi:RNA polymerase-binding transcription factor DksA
MTEKTKYSDTELEEFKAIILEKLEIAKKDYDMLRAGLTNSDGNDVSDTSPTFKVLEEGAATLSKEEAGRLAQRQMKFIQSLQAALIRIENKTYGICRETGKLIAKDRLRAVPHATLSIEAKQGGVK